ncbi:MAG: hypothetical protein E7566_07630 [Ruminococcaceae bacterium]|nr:hypothetical protein [Oscillospiraceae bacterium]
MSKKILSIVLALVMVLAMGTVALVSVSADLATLPEQPADTYRYYFYMPEQWLNDSTATTGNTAGIYWWEGTDAHGGWPGVAANEADAPGVYYYDVPTDVTTIIWNNFFDGGADISAPYYPDAIQTRNIGTEYYDAGESDLYPEGTENFDGMIYVVDFGIYDYNDYSKKMQFGGEWFYYYGNGEYGTSKVKGESEVRTERVMNEELGMPIDKGDPNATTESTVTEPQPTTTTEPAPIATTTTQAAPVVPDGCTTDITFAGTEVKSACIDETITYTMDLTAARLFENIQAVVTYDSTVLELVRIKSDDPDVADWEVEGPVRCPNLEGVIFNAGTDGLVKFNASKVSGYNFKEAKNLVTLEFKVIAEGATAISTVIEEMTIKGDGTESYFTGGQAVITEGITIVEDLQVPDHPVPTTTTEKVTTTAEVKTTVTASDVKTTATVGEPITNPTNEVGTTGTGEVVAPPTGAAAYIYIAIAIMAMAACAVVVLRKKANG